VSGSLGQSINHSLIGFLKLIVDVSTSELMNAVSELGTVGCCEIGRKWLLVIEWERVASGNKYRR
jgi:hypothetical protein